MAELERQKRIAQQKLEKKREREKEEMIDKIMRLAGRRKMVKEFRERYLNVIPFIWKMEQPEIQRWMVKSHQKALQSLGDDVDPLKLDLWEVVYPYWHKDGSYEGLLVVINWDADRKRRKVLDIGAFQGKFQAYGSPFEDMTISVMRH